ncbi:hypothetical protein FA13DRAFT_1360572 [Coprinellus micaceus]|jgi:uncharacterized protein (DUF952 family)|uniref:DUF952 domain-containing protein n=1 Tax=Coprinellus micaceus TaxID=71717 RepID=A0A4Y7TN31_COPMI|nr:hypothetical protein FA13DRAFT_1360572 [Coprinellus micaceus]
MSPPTYIYKIVPASSAPPDPLPDRLPVSNLDATDGFIHLSTAKQVARTLDRYFNGTGNERIYLLRLDYAKIKGHVKWETPQGGV